METLIQFGGAVVVTVICVWIAERGARRTVQNTVYMVRPKRERS